MNCKMFFLVACCFLSSVLFAQKTLSIEIINLRNDLGQVQFVLCNENEEQVATVSEMILENKCLIVLDSLNVGTYSFKFFHDENKNQLLDVNWLGIPREGFGFSNEPSMSFGPPCFEKTLFSFECSTVIICKPKYFK